MSTEPVYCELETGQVWTDRKRRPTKAFMIISFAGGIGGTQVLDEDTIQKDVYFSEPQFRRTFRYLIFKPMFLPREE